VPHTSTAPYGGGSRKGSRSNLLRGIRLPQRGELVR
jgi:hypothetical protein